MTGERGRSPLSRVDLALIALALLFGAVTLAWPFGRDQGLFFYIGREWLHGRGLPYRDMMEQKTPFIYLLHALSILIFGEQLWGIRVLELLWVTSVGALLGAVAAPAGERPRPGVRGLTALAASIWYFGCFNFWDTAQTEIWEAGFAMLSLWAVMRMKSLARGALVGGLFGGLAVLAKPPGALLVGVVGLALVERVWRDRRPPHVLLYPLAAALPIVVALGYLAAAGAWPDFVDQVVHANRYYVEHEARVGGFADAFRMSQTFIYHINPLWSLEMTALGLGLAMAWRRRSWARARRYVFAGLLVLAAYVAVYVQAKFFFYHWGAIALPLALVVGCVADDLARREPGRSWFIGAGRASASTDADGHAIRQGPRFGSDVACLALAGLLLATYASTGKGAFRYLELARGLVQYATGELERQEYLRLFDSNELHYSWADNEEVGEWIKARIRPGELVAERGFEPGVYMVSGTRAPTRFFWTTWLADPRRAYRREAWLAEDLAALKRRPPRFVVVYGGKDEGPNSRQYFWPLGYGEVYHRHNLVVMERGRGQPAAAARGELEQPATTVSGGGRAEDLSIPAASSGERE